MKCAKCGDELPENVTRCPNCGADNSTDINTNTDTISGVAIKPHGFSSKRNIITIVIAALLVLGGVGAAVAVGVSHSAAQGSGRFQLAEKYLSEQNYEQAIIAFEQILEIEPMNVDAYLGLAEAYIGKGDTEKALEVLKNGLEMTGDARLQAKIDELIKPEKPVASSSSSSTSSATSESTPAESEANQEISAYSEYDAENRLVFEQLIGTDGIITQNDYGEQYDSRGNLIGWGLVSTLKSRENGIDDIFISDSGDQDGYHFETIYDDRGELLKETETGNDVEIGYDDGKPTYGTYSRISTYVNEYGEFGIVKATRTTVVSENGKTIDTDVDEFLYEYDSQGRKMSEIHDGKLICEWKYSDEGRSVEEHRYSYSNGQVYINHIIIRKYDANGRLFNYESTSTDVMSGEIRRSYVNTWEFDSSGKLVEFVTREFDSYEQTEYISVTKYTDTGYEKHYSGTQKGIFEEYTETWVYEDDEFGRVITETGTKNDGSFAGKVVYEY